MDKPSKLTICNHPLIQNKLTHLRDKKTGCARFSGLIFELSTLLIYEVLRTLSVRSIQIETPLESMQSSVCGECVTFVPILRAGIRMGDAGLSILHSARVCHLGLKRDETTYQPSCYYEGTVQSGELGRYLILDPMIATGGSAVDAISRVKRWGAHDITYVAVIASPYGISQIHTYHENVPVFVAALDHGLNDKNYIVPGLGDAGDRQFGT